MTTLELQGQITENGDLEIQLPAGLPAGKVTVRIEVPERQADADSQAWTDEEIQEMMKPRRKTMKDLAAWLDANPPTDEWGGMKPEDDPSEFIHNLRHQKSVDLEDPETLSDHGVRGHEHSDRSLSKYSRGKIMVSGTS